MAVLSMTKPEFSRLDVLLRVQSGWPFANGCEPIISIHGGAEAWSLV
jgi:hypothetical protein